MLLLRETKALLDRIEKLSGRSVQFVADSALPLLTTIQTARHGAPFHLLRYRPSGTPLDYRIAFQAGYTLRLFEVDEADRFDFAPSASATTAVEELVAGGLPLSDSEKATLKPFAEFVARWALLQLRSLPIGLRIDQWIYDSMPVLRSQQAEGMAEIQQQNLDASTRSVGRLNVPPHLAATNAAYALFCDRLLGKDWYVLPYRAMGLLEDGKKLVSISESVSPEPIHDRELVDRWADFLGMRGWYKWVPYTP
jgi:hypothetical protein